MIPRLSINSGDIFISTFTSTRLLEYKTSMAGVHSPYAIPVVAKIFDSSSRVVLF
jgi:hypothetical protein